VDVDDIMVDVRYIDCEGVIMKDTSYGACFTLRFATAV
jgi:hypothetical protein